MHLAHMPLNLIGHRSTRRPPSGNLFNIKISDLFNDEDRQAALEPQKQLTTQLEQTINEREIQVEEIEMERESRKKKAQKKIHIRQYHEMEIGRASVRSHSTETFKKPTQHKDLSKPRH